MAAKTLSNLGILFTERRDFYLRPNVVKELWTDITPFTTILANKGEVKVSDTDYKLFEHRSGFIHQELMLNDATPAVWTDVGGVGGPGSTTTQIVDGIVGLSGAIDSYMLGLEVEIFADAAGKANYATHKGVAVITAVDAGAGTITLKALGNPYAADNLCTVPLDDDHFYVIGNIQGVGTEAPEAYSDELEVVFNSPQIFKTAVEVDGDLYEAALRGYSNELARLRLEKNKEHKLQIERALLFGVRMGGTGLVGGDSHQYGHTTNAAGKSLRSTMGVISAINRYGTASGDKQNKFTVDGNYAFSNFVDDCEKVFQYIPTSGEKIAFCGPTALSYWSKVDAAAGFATKSGFSVQLARMERDSMGYNFRRLETPHGVIRLVPAPVLRGPYARTMVVVDQDDLDLTMYRADKFQANIKTENAYDGVKDNYFSDKGVAMTMIEKHSVWTITA